MQSLTIPGCWYCDTIPGGGNFAASQLNIPATKTKFGDIVGRQLLWTVMSPDGTRFCGAGHFDDIAHEHSNSGWQSLGKALGSHPIIYRDNGELTVISEVVGAPTGSQGWRYVDDNGDLISSDDTIAPGARLAIQYNVTSLWQFTVRRDGKYVVGELQDGVGARINGRLIRINSLIESIPKEQQSRDVHFKIDNDKISISWYFFRTSSDVTSCFLWMTVAEFEALVDNQPTPEPPTGNDETMIPAFDRPMWQAPFFSHHSRYGDTEISKHVGNAIWIPASEIERVKPLGKPLIVHPDATIPDWANNTTIAYWATGGSISELTSKVNEYLSMLPEKPIIAYLDSRMWPESNPFNSDKVWPSIQVYRFPNESLSFFESELTSVIERVKDYNLPMCLTSRFDDFNGSSTVANILECMPLYDKWIRNYFFVAHMPFSDRRGNAISSNESLWKWARTFQYAIPSERPNRFDYWKPQNSSIKDVLKNKLGQQRAAVVLENYLREDISKKYEDGNNPGPVEPPPVGEWPNLLSTVQDVRNKYPALVSKSQSVAIINEVAWIHRDDGFGLLKKESGTNGPQPITGILCSTDWLISKKYNRGLDCLGAAPNSDEPAPANPQWHGGESPVDLTRFVDPVQP